MLSNAEYNTIWSFFPTAWNAVIGWFNTLMSASGMLPIILGVIIAMLAIRFIVYPALKPNVGSSDTVKKKKVKK